MAINPKTKTALYEALDSIWAHGEMLNRKLDRRLTPARLGEIYEQLLMLKAAAQDGIDAVLLAIEPRRRATDTPLKESSL